MGLTDAVFYKSVCGCYANFGEPYGLDLKRKNQRQFSRDDMRGMRMPRCAVLCHLLFVVMEFIYDIGG